MVRLGLSIIVLVLCVILLVYVGDLFWKIFGVAIGVVLIVIINTAKKTPTRTNPVIRGRGIREWIGNFFSSPQKETKPNEMAVYEFDSMTKSDCEGDKLSNLINSSKAYPFIQNAIMDKCHEINHPQKPSFMSGIFKQKHVPEKFADLEAQEEWPRLKSNPADRKSLDKAVIQSVRSPKQFFEKFYADGKEGAWKELWIELSELNHKISKWKRHGEPNCMVRTLEYDFKDKGKLTHVVLRQRAILPAIDSGTLIIENNYTTSGAPYVDTFTIESVYEIKPHVNGVEMEVKLAIHIIKRVTIVTDMILSKAPVVLLEKLKKLFKHLNKV